ncbi:MAG: hypothetical protein M1540_02650 [Candidatus Bathyarchaeota archaeon]|nr:hypothetical protein [Candidatus Bathyarchaeota archaeon]
MTRNRSTVQASGLGKRNRRSCLPEGLLLLVFIHLEQCRHRILEVLAGYPTA